MAEVIDPTTSENFYALKVASILTVVAGHYFQNAFPLVWVPTALTMLAFAYASAFFTDQIYGRRRLDAGPYWWRKVSRLGLALLVIDVFLISVALIEGRNGIFTWQAGLCLMGLQGFLNWFHVPNPSPFGAGMWFFTLLLLFYAVYPVLAPAFRWRGPAYLFVISWVVAAFWLHHHVVYGHVLWLATCGFALGLLSSRHPLKLTRACAVEGLIVVAGVAAAANWAGQAGANFLFLLGIFWFGILFWHEIVLPSWVHRVLKPFRGCLLEIYLIHGALFVHPTENLWVDFFFTLILVLAVAKGLEYVRHRLRFRLLASAPASI